MKNFSLDKQHVIEKMRSNLVPLEAFSSEYQDPLSWNSAPALADKVIPFRVDYSLDADNEQTLHVGGHLSIQHKGLFQCSACQKIIKKIYSGYCYVCLHKKASADWCVLNPHLCHFAQGTCREPDWGASFCYQPHLVYLSFTDKYKVGITRKTHLWTRWVDQGATAASALCITSSRHQAGNLEKALTQILADKSHWQKMLKAGNNRPSSQDFIQKRREVLAWLKETLQNNTQIIATSTNTPFENLDLYPEGNKITFLEHAPIVNINFPIPTDSDKIKSISLEKSPAIKGQITGLKGQYIFLGEQVFNMRSHEGFIVDFEYYG